MNPAPSHALYSVGLQRGFKLESDQNETMGHHFAKDKQIAIPSATLTRFARAKVFALSPELLNEPGATGTGEHGSAGAPVLGW